MSSCLCFTLIADNSSAYHVSTGKLGGSHISTTAILSQRCFASERGTSSSQPSSTSFCTNSCSPANCSHKSAVAEARLPTSSTGMKTLLLGMSLKKQWGCPPTGKKTACCLDRPWLETKRRGHEDSKAEKVELSNRGGMKNGTRSQWGQE